MKITKFVHACLLVEMPEPVNRTALFDPGIFSESSLDVESLQWLDDIVITHLHPDHMSIPLIQKLMQKFPDARLSAPSDASKQLVAAGLNVTAEIPDGIVEFDAPHEMGDPLFSAPEQLAVHYLGMLTHPGDSHQFEETKVVLALPVQAPWGSTRNAVNLALRLKPQYVLPVHDWHWSEDARTQMYDRLEAVFKEHNITFCKLATGTPVVLDV